MCQRIISQRYRRFLCFQMPKENPAFSSVLLHEATRRRRDYIFPSFLFHLGGGERRLFWDEALVVAWGEKKVGSYFAGK